MEAQLELKRNSCVRLEHDIVQLRQKIDDLKAEIEKGVGLDEAAQDAEAAHANCFRAFK